MDGVARYPIDEGSRVQLSRGSAGKQIGDEDGSLQGRTKETSRSAKNMDTPARDGGSGGQHCYPLSIDGSMTCTSWATPTSSSGRYSVATATPSPDTSGSHGFFSSNSPAGTPVATAAPRCTVDLCSGSPKIAPAGASTVAAEAAGVRHDSCSLSPATSTPSSICSSTGRKGIFFPCHPPSPLSFGSASPDRFFTTGGRGDGGGRGRPGLQRSTAAAAGMIAGSPGGTTSSPSWSVSSCCASPSASSYSKTRLPSPLSVVRVPLATLSGRRREDGGGGGGGIPTKGTSPPPQPKWPSSPSQWVVAAAAGEAPRPSRRPPPPPALATAAAGTTPRRTPSTTLCPSDSSPAGSGTCGRCSCPVTEQAVKQERNNSSRDDDVRRIRSIEDFGWGPLRPATTTTSSRRGIAGVSGNQPKTSTAKRSRCSLPPGSGGADDGQRPGGHRRGGGTNSRPRDGGGNNGMYSSRSGRGAHNPSSSSSDSEKASDDSFAILGVPPALTATHGSSGGCGGDGRGVGRGAGAGAGDGGASPDGSMNGMGDMLRSFGDIAVSSHGDMPAGSSGGRVLPRTRALRSRRSFADVVAGYTVVAMDEEIAKGERDRRLKSAPSKLASEEGGERERGRRLTRGPSQQKARRAGPAAHHSEDSAHREGAGAGSGGSFSAKKDHNGNDSSRSSSRCGFHAGPGGGAGGGMHRADTEHAEDGGGMEEEEPDGYSGSNSSGSGSGSGEVVEVWKTHGGRRTSRLPTPKSPIKNFSKYV